MSYSAGLTLSKWPKPNPIWRQSLFRTDDLQLPLLLKTKSSTINTLFSHILFWETSWIELFVELFFGECFSSLSDEILLLFDYVNASPSGWCAIAKCKMIDIRSKTFQNGLKHERNLRLPFQRHNQYVIISCMLLFVHLRKQEIE